MNLHGPSMPTRALVGFLLLSTAPTFADTVLFNSGPINEFRDSGLLLPSVQWDAYWCEGWSRSART